MHKSREAIDEQQKAMQLDNVSHPFIITKEFKEAIEIADKLESEICDMDLGLTYTEIAKTAEFTAMKIREQIPMYTENLNPKWKMYDDVIAILKGRINGG